MKTNCTECYWVAGFPDENDKGLFCHIQEDREFLVSNVRHCDRFRPMDGKATYCAHLRHYMYPDSLGTLEHDNDLDMGDSEGPLGNIQGTLLMHPSEKFSCQ